GRLFNKELGGGSLLDIGIYPIYLSHLVLGQPERIQATARMSTTGVDSSCAMLFDYAQGAKATLESTFEANTPLEAYIYGSDGYIKLHPHFYHTKKITLCRYDGKNEVFDIGYRGNGYLYEIEEVEQCLSVKRQQSEKLSPDTSLQIIRTIDRVKEKIGLSYR
ncbi:MAG: Gfo/Idh/MocA family oxidoreductase, partial [bacterium]